MQKLKRKKVDLDPLLEFPDDPMMQELHKARIKIYEETKGMSFEEELRYYKQKSEQFFKPSKG